jgi:hypothetical protein
LLENIKIDWEAFESQCLMSIMWARQRRFAYARDTYTQAMYNLTLTN